MNHLIPVGYAWYGCTHHRELAPDGQREKEEEVDEADAVHGLEALAPVLTLSGDSEPLRSLTCISMGRPASFGDPARVPVLVLARALHREVVHVDLGLRREQDQRRHHRGCACVIRVCVEVRRGLTRRTRAW